MLDENQKSARLKNQRIRWQRGLAESLWLNKSMMFAKNSGAAGWLAFPFMFFFEMLGPLLELTGLIMMIAAYYFGLIDYHAAIAMLILAFGIGIFVVRLGLVAGRNVLPYLSSSLRFMYIMSGPDSGKFWLPSAKQLLAFAWHAALAVQK